MAVSAAFDVPTYVWCLQAGTPHDCNDGSLGYAIVWSFHLLSLCGYSLCLCIPVFLWYCMILGRPVDLFSFSYPDFTKVFLHFSIICYSLVQLLTIAIVVVMGITSFQKHTSLYASMGCLSSLFELLMIAIWLAVGLQLQRLVYMSARNVSNILLSVNMVLCIVLCTNLLRAFMVFELDVPFVDRDIMTTYWFWILSSQYLPFVVSNFLLMSIMKLSTRSDSPSVRYSSTASGKWAPSFLLLSQSSSQQDEYFATFSNNNNVNGSDSGVVTPLRARSTSLPLEYPFIP